MNYLKMHFGGEERGFKFGIGYLRYLQENSSIGLKELGLIFTENDALKYPILVYYSLKFNAIKSKTEFPHDQYDIDDWIDEAGGLNGAFMIEFVTALSKSLQFDEGKNPPQGKGAKK